MQDNEGALVCMACGKAKAEHFTSTGMAGWFCDRNRLTYFVRFPHAAPPPNAWHKPSLADITESRCGLCGEPMPAGEEMFQYHGHSGPCPAPKEESDNG